MKSITDHNKTSFKMQPRCPSTSKFCRLALLVSFLSALVGRLTPANSRNIVLMPFDQNSGPLDYEETLLKWMKQYWRHPVIVNIHQYTYMCMFQNHSCLVVIDNYLHVDLPDIPVPIVLRRPYVLKFLERQGSSGDLQFYRWVWGAKHASSDNTNLTWFSAIGCRLSKYLSSGGNLARESSDICLLLNSGFVVNSKEWHIQIHFEIYPPSHLEKGIYEGLFIHFGMFINMRHPTIFKSSRSGNHKPFPSLSMIQLNCMVIPEYYMFPETLWSFLMWLKVWAMFIYQNKISQDLFLLLPVTLLIKKGGFLNSSRLQNPDGTIQKSSQLMLADSTELYHREIPKFPQNLNEVQLLIHLSFPLTHECTRWKVDFKDTRSTGLKLFEIMLQLLLKYRMSEKLPDYHSNPSSPTVKLAFGYMQVWRAIMKNYTLDLKHLSEYNFQIHLQYNTFLKASNVVQYPISDPGTNLRFVSCGRGIYNSLKFQELFAVYDRFVWTCILISVSTVAMVTAQSYNDLWTKFVLSWKVLFEQGDPLMGADAKLSKLSVSLGLYLLMGTVISNGYKNTNVYNMIVPRRPIPFETFQELSLHSFTIYTLSGEIKSIPGYELWRTDTSRDVCSTTLYHKAQGDPFQLCAKSEVDELVGTFEHLTTSYDPFRKVVRDNATTSNLISLGVQKESRMHPAFSQDLRTFGFLDVNIRFNEQLEDLKINESRYTFKSLSECHGTALILPEYLCRSYAMNLKVKNVEDVFVGKEVYFDIESHFSLKGLVPPYVIARWEGVGLGGIWERWRKLAMSGFTYDMDSITVPPRPAKMSGNVIVVFAVWLVGVIVSISGYALEIISWNIKFRERILTMWKYLRDLKISYNGNLFRCR